MYTQLPEGENCLIRSNQHWITFLCPILWLLFGGTLWVVLAMYVDWPWIWIAPALLLLWGLIGMARQALEYFSTEFVVTDHRIILKKGILTREALELMIDKCEGVNVTQTLSGRIFNYGTIEVTTGEISNTYEMVRDPFAFRDAISKAAMSDDE